MIAPEIITQNGMHALACSMDAISESKFTEGYFLINHGLSTDFTVLLFTKKYTSYSKCVVDIICGRVWFGTDF